MDCPSVAYCVTSDAIWLLRASFVWVFCFRLRLESTAGKTLAAYITMTDAGEVWVWQEGSKAGRLVGHGYPSQLAHNPPACEWSKGGHPSLHRPGML